MTLLSVPPLDDTLWPTLGPQVISFLEERAVFGPGSLRGEPARLDAEKKAIICRAYEVYPRGHRLAGRRRFQRVGVSLPKGSSKTELLAWIAYAELHPEGPVRFDGWDARGNPVGRPVRDPYVPLVGFSEEQTEELAYGALYVICAEGPDADRFDVGLDRIIRLDEWGRPDGKATALAAAPNARDGARTTFEGFDETHRLYLPKLIDAHTTMLANLTKRPLDDPWHLEVTTAGQLGQGSIAEKTHKEALAIEAGEYKNPDLLYHHRQAKTGRKLATLEQRVAAVAEARGGVGEYAPGQFEQIARQWDRPNADRSYLARVWLNQWVRGDEQAFDPIAWESNHRPGCIQRDELVTIGFDGARFRDSTALVATDVVTGMQELFAIWERPSDLPEGAEWEVPEAEVTEALQQAMIRWQVWKVYADPPHWTETVGSWAGRWPDRVEEWWTNRTKPMAYAVRQYREAIASAQLTVAEGSPLIETFDRHVAGAGRRLVNLWDDHGQQLYILRKVHQDRKFDACMAGILSWQARLEALRQGARKKNRTAPRRIR